MEQCYNLSLENIIMGNIQGLYPKTNQAKVPFLRELSAEVEPLVIALTETHLSSSVKDEEIQIKNYTPFRTDREIRSHGGAIIYVRNEISVDTKSLLSYSNGQVELIIIHLRKMNLIIVNCYRPPQCTLHNFTAAMEKVAKIMEDQPAPLPEVILCGDFNFPSIHWPEGTVAGGTLDDQAQAKLLLDFTDKIFLTQQITKPTRAHNILDLFFTNNQDAIETYKVEKTIVLDHSLITINMTYRKTRLKNWESNKTESSPFAKFNFYSETINWELVQCELGQVDWGNIMGGNNPNTMLQAFINTVLEMCEGHIPIKKKSASAQRHNIPRDRRILMRKRASLHKQLTVSQHEKQRHSISRKIEEIEQKL